MQDPIFWLAISAIGLIGLVIVARTMLIAWRGWLELERMRLDGRQPRAAMAGAPSPAARIELADLKERVRKLEAIAAGVDL